MDFSLLAEHPLYAATGLAYLGAFVCYALVWASTNATFGKVGTGLMAVAVAGNAGLIVARWIEAQRPPFQSLFESLVFLAFCIAAVYLGYERIHRTRVFGVAAAAGAFGMLLVALAKWEAEIVRLPPALQSGWFIPHVAAYFFGYAALFMATAFSIVQLFKPTLTARAETPQRGPISVEDLAYKTIRLGFVLLTFGLLVGAVWAKSAWGDYWFWDPKENWALVSWLVYASYLHLRHVKGWRGNRVAWLSIAGFAVVMFTYLGMELLPTAAESAHVYAN
ncbi:MAG: c-type cytochrome biogenesis protein CcsB [Myxococcales bacterium]